MPAVPRPETWGFRLHATVLPLCQPVCHRKTEALIPMKYVAVVLFVFGHLLAGSGSGQGAFASQHCGTSVQAFEELRREADKSGLVVVYYGGPYPYSAEGAQILSYYDGTEIRHVEATLYGEMGRIDLKFVVLGPHEYLVSYRDIYYEAHIIESGGEDLSHEITETLHICDHESVALIEKTDNVPESQQPDLGLPVVDRKPSDLLDILTELQGFLENQGLVPDQ